MYATCMYVFWAGHLVLDHQLVCSSLWKTVSTVSSIDLPAVLCVKWRTLELPSLHIKNGVILVQVMFMQPCW